MGGERTRRGAPLWLCGVMAVLLHVAALIGVGAIERSRPAEVSRVLPDERRTPEDQPDLGNPDFRIESLAWIGEAQDTGRSPNVRETDQAEQRLASPGAEPREAAEAARAVAEAGREALERVRRALSDAARTAAAGVRSIPLPRAVEAEPVGSDEEIAAEPEEEVERAELAEGGGEQSPDPIEQAEVEAEPLTPGDDDREAVATAAIELDDLGQPIEDAGGLRITTVRPDLSRYTRVRTLPRDPTVVLTFGADGRVSRVEWVTRTGSVFFDEDLENALHRWRAEGAEILEAPELSGRDVPGTPDLTRVRIRIKL